MDINEMLEAEEMHMRKMQELVQKAVEEEKLLSQKLIEADADLKISWGDKIADKIAVFGGSWFFIISFSVVIIFWIILNAYLMKLSAFDPYPFILLNLVLSCLAALQAPVIMMSQNRQEEKDRRRARNDYMINLKAEIEVRNLHEKVDIILSDQMKYLFEIQKKQVEIMNDIKKSITQNQSQNENN